MASRYKESLAHIRRVVMENPDLDEKETRRVVSDSYPYRERRGWCYKAWLRAVEALLGPSKRKTEHTKRKSDPCWPNPTGSLFEE